MQNPEDIEGRRALALDAACRIAPQGTPTSGVLSRARELETYLATGVVRYDGQAGTLIHAGGLKVALDGPPGLLTPGKVELVRAAVEEALA